MEINKKEYGAYVKEITPVHSTLKNVCAAFVSGGAICVLGQGLINGFKMNGMEQDAASAWTLMCLIFLSVLLTGLNVFQKLAKFCGAGVLVPITGFANSVASPALEYKDTVWNIGKRGAWSDVLDWGSDGGYLISG